MALTKVKQPVRHSPVASDKAEPHISPAGGRADDSPAKEEAAEEKPASRRGDGASSKELDFTSFLSVRDTVIVFHPLVQ